MFVCTVSIFVCVLSFWCCYLVFYSTCDTSTSGTTTCGVVAVVVYGVV